MSIFEKDKKSKNDLEHWMPMLPHNGISTDEPDPFEPYVDGKYDAVSSENIYNVKHLRTLAGGGIVTYVGIHVKTGEFYEVSSRQVSCGAATGGEDRIDKISLEEFKKLTDIADITEENALDFVPEERRKITTIYDLSEKIVPDGKVMCNVIYDVAWMQVKIIRRFGTNELTLKKYKDGYRVFSRYWSEYYSSNDHSRRISNQELNYILNALPMVKPLSGSGNEEGHSNISIYGGERIFAKCILCSGKTFYFGGSSYNLKVYDRLSDVSKHIILTQGQDREEEIKKLL